MTSESEMSYAEAMQPVDNAEQKEVAAKEMSEAEQKEQQKEIWKAELAMENQSVAELTRQLEGYGEKSELPGLATRETLEAALTERNLRIKEIKDRLNEIAA